MKRAILVMFAFSILAAFVTLAWAAMDHSKMHEMMMQHGGPQPDDRIELTMPEPMKVMQKRRMREHFDTLGEITAALAANDLKKAAAISKEKLGWNATEEEMCSMMSEAAGQQDFMPLGMAMHKKADELSENAAAGNRDKALANLAELINRCNACHNRFRH